MKLFNKEPLIQQTEFSSSQTWLEEPSITTDEQLENAERKIKRRKITLIAIGSIVMIAGLLALLINIMTRPPAEIVIVAEPTATPTVTPVLTPLLSRITDAKARTQAIDVREAELALPQVEFTIFLDEPKKQ